jgi:putative ABC transport system ATP-binding protein
LRGVTKCYAAAGTEFQLLIPRLDIRPGAKLAFVGESGSGKSTLLELLSMILQPSKCEMFSFQPLASGQSHDICAAWAVADTDTLTDLRSRHIGYVLQNGGLIPYLTVRENIELSRRLLALPFEDCASQWAQKLGIGEQLDKLPATLSVGQRQRVAIARALVHEPSVVIADEPTAAIDPLNAEHIMRLLTALADELGVALIVATHALDLAQRMELELITHTIEATDNSSMTVTVSQGC